MKKKVQTQICLNQLLTSPLVLSNVSQAMTIVVHVQELVIFPIREAVIGVYICFLDKGMLSYCLTLSRTSFSIDYLHNFSINFCTTLCWGEQKDNSCAVYVYLLVLPLTFGLVTIVLPVCTRKVCMNKLVTLPTPKKCRPHCIHFSR
jgi:hypothetical protein